MVVNSKSCAVLEIAYTRACHITHAVWEMAYDMNEKIILVRCGLFFCVCIARVLHAVC